MILIQAPLLRPLELLARLQRKHGKGKALSILAHKLGRAVYTILARGTVFSHELFLHA
ncbi:MAG: hypothetical protein WEF50_09725 [Myxococcota bacterium]